jgi:hypothetical protein
MRLILTGLLISLSPFAWSAGLEASCKEAAERAVLAEFRDAKPDMEFHSAEVQKEVPIANGYRLQILAHAFVPGPYDGTKASLYSVDIIDTKTCQMGMIELVEDYDIAD